MKISQIIALAVLVAGLAAWTVIDILTSVSPREVDTATYCPSDGEIPRHLIILIDTTDKLPDYYAKEVSGFIERSRNNIAAYEKLTILHLKNAAEDDPENKQILQSKLSLCSPGTRKEMEGVNIAGRRVANTYEWKFNAPIKNIVEELPKLPEAANTPLFEALIQISRRPDFGPDVPKRQLIIFSDFLQYTPEINHYRRPIESVKALQKRGVEIADFSDTHVGIIYINRDAKEGSSALQSQNRSHRQFWNDFFEEANVASVNWLLQNNYSVATKTKRVEKQKQRKRQRVAFNIRPPLKKIYVTSPYGFRTDPVTGGIDAVFHDAVDLRAKTGTPIYAVAAGSVKTMEPLTDDKSFGHHIVLEHADKYTTLYAHMSRFSDKLLPGARIKKGDLIGYSGATGYVNAPHLHFGVYKEGKPLNPCRLNIGCNR